MHITSICSFPRPSLERLGPPFRKAHLVRPVQKFEPHPDLVSPLAVFLHDNRHTEDTARDEETNNSSTIFRTTCVQVVVIRN